MGNLWLPDKATRQQVQARQEYQAAVLGAADLHAKLEKWNYELKKFDMSLQLVKASESAQAQGLKPGYYHIIKDNGMGFAPGIVVHQGPNGEFREPDSGLFRELMEADLWDDRVVRDRERRRKQLEEAEARAKAREAEERRQEFAERWKARTNPGVSMAGKNWTYKHGARRG